MPLLDTPIPQPSAAAGSQDTPAASYSNTAIVVYVGPDSAQTDLEQGLQIARGFGDVMWSSPMLWETHKTIVVAYFDRRVLDTLELGQARNSSVWRILACDSIEAGQALSVPASLGIPTQFICSGDMSEAFAFVQRFGDVKVSKFQEVGSLLFVEYHDMRCMQAMQMALLAKIRDRPTFDTKAAEFLSSPGMKWIASAQGLAQGTQSATQPIQQQPQQLQQPQQQQLLLQSSLQAQQLLLQQSLQTPLKRTASAGNIRLPTGGGSTGAVASTPHGVASLTSLRGVQTPFTGKKPLTALTPVVKTEDTRIDIGKLEQGLDSRTTVMIRNIPNKLNQQKMVKMIDQFVRSDASTEIVYDFFYVPIDVRNCCNVGYAFINFTRPQNIVAFHRAFHGCDWRSYNSNKICELAYARVQGKVALIKHFACTKFLTNPEYRPLFFDTATGQYSNNMEVADAQAEAARNAPVLATAQQQQLPDRFGAMTPRSSSQYGPVTGSPSTIPKLVGGVHLTPVAGNGRSFPRAQTLPVSEQNTSAAGVAAAAEIQQALSSVLGVSSAGNQGFLGLTPANSAATTGMASPEASNNTSPKKTAEELLGLVRSVTSPDLTQLVSALSPENNTGGGAGAGAGGIGNSSSAAGMSTASLVELLQELTAAQTSSKLDPSLPPTSQ